MIYYNDIDKKACAWLHELMRADLIPQGDIDDRSIKEVKPDELRKYTQCHFFAGIGGWAYALRLAGIGTNNPIWTGSCPCQPFSAAGKRKGTADERHLWPDFARLIAECKPSICYGEQVASKDGRLWLAGVRSDLEGMGYAVGAADLCAAGVGAPHIRQRLYWVAYSNGAGREQHVRAESVRAQQFAPELYSSNSGVEYSTIARSGGLSNKQRTYNIHTEWSSPALILCAKGKTRRIKPGVVPLVNGLPGRVGLLRGYGNAIVPQIATEFINAHWDILLNELV